MSPHSPVVVRIGTQDRSAVSRELIAHHQAGRVDRCELEARLALAASARTEEDLRLVLLDLPDAPLAPHHGPVPGAPRLVAQPAPRNETLGVTFDVMVMLLTLAAFVCTALLFAVSSGSMRGDERVVLSLAAFGSFSIGAGAVHLAHRVFHSTR